MRLPRAQGCGRAPFEKVLAPAARLLNGVGAEGLTTNQVAGESPVNTSSIYTYFSNKQAILMAVV